MFARCFPTIFCKPDVAYHSITAMVGAGVLGLPHVFAQLGWAGGIIMLAFSFWVSWYTYKLLVYMHEVPDLACKGGIRRLDRYDQVADYVLGPKRGKKVLMPFQVAVLLGMATTYTVVGGDSLYAFAHAVAPEIQINKWAFYLMFGGLEVLLSLAPSFTELSLVSLMGAIMSVAYCTIAVVMAATVNPSANGVSYNPASIPRTPVAKAMGIFNALTSILFAYGGHNVAVEIQATLPMGGKHPNSTVPAMMKGVNVTFILTGLCYFGVACVGFWAFGTGVTENVLMAFSKGPNHWVVAMADMFVVVHVAAAYQVYSHPVFQVVEAAIKHKTRAERVNPVAQLSLRLVYVGLITMIGIIIPFFGSLMGLVGAIAITPTTFLLPPLLWLIYKKPERWSLEWTINAGLVCVTGVMGVLGSIGATYGIVTAWNTYRLFAN